MLCMYYHVNKNYVQAKSIDMGNIHIFSNYEGKRGNLVGIYGKVVTWHRR